MKLVTELRAKVASEHELATMYREAKEEGDSRNENRIVMEALSRGISKEQLAEIR